MMKNLLRFFNRNLVPQTEQSKIVKKSPTGFTIIEVLIVLAIAGLILLIVFEAIPQLDRSSRNNQRKQDVQAILEAVSDYELDNSGNFPPTCGDGGSDPSCFGTGNLLQYANLTYYNVPSANVIVYNTSDTDSGDGYYFGDVQSLTAHPKKKKYNISVVLNEVVVYNYETCDSNNDGGATQGGAGYNDVVALYAIETGSSSTSAQGECQQL